MTDRDTSADPRPNDEPDSPTEVTKQSGFAVLRRSVAGIRDDNLTDWAAALTYYGVLAIFPGLLVLVSILGLLGPAATRSLEDNIGQIAPGGIRSFLSQVIENAQSQHSTASITAVIGLVLALWSSSSYIAAFMRASNAIYGVGEGRPIWKTIPVRVGVTLAVVIMLVISSAIVLLTGRVADQVGQALGIGQTAVTAWNVAKWPVLVVIVALTLALLYWACPNVKQPRFPWVSPGSALAVIIWLIASGGFAVYVANFASYNKTYGSVAGVIIFLVWLWISNLAILVGAEVDAEIDHQRAIAAGLPPGEESFAVPRDTRKLDDEDTKRAEELARRRTT
jgi:membrane protein